MTKVLRIINRFNLGGPTFNVAYLTKFMAPEFETLLVGGQKDDSEDSSEFIVNKLGLEPIIIPEMRREISFKNDYIAYKKIKQLIEEFKPDVVHTHASKAGAIGRLAAYNCGVPVVVHTFHGHVFHSYFGKLKTAFYKGVERHLGKKSTTIIAISNKQKRELTEEHGIAPKDKFSVVQLGFDLSRFRENMDEKRANFRSTYNLAEDELAIGIVGRLVPIKNHELFLRAIAEIKKKTKRSFRAIVIGDGELMDELQETCKMLNLVIGDNNSCDVTFTSWIRDVDRAYAGVDIVALTSKNEGTPVSLIEAQASGRPIVSTRVGGVEDILLENESGFLTENLNLASLVEHLLKLVENDELRIKMGNTGWDHVRVTYDYMTLVNNMKSLYRNLLDQVSSK